MFNKLIGKAIAVVLLVIVILFATLLDKSDERRKEIQAADFSKLPMTSVLPQYLGSLFLGAFRAVAIDMLWINYGEICEEKRYFEAKEILELISHLQPNNEIVWDYLAWDAAYNLPNAVKEPDEKWRWIRYGISKLEEGSHQIRNSPYLCYQIGYVLLQKATFAKGFLQYDFINNFERDIELQKTLAGRDVDKPIPLFELAVEWFEKAKDKLKEYKKQAKVDYYVSGGLVIHDYVIDSFIRDCLYTEAIVSWYKGFDFYTLKWSKKSYYETLKWLDKAIVHLDLVINSYNREFDRQHRKFYKKLRDALPEVYEAFNFSSLDDKIKALTLMENILKGSEGFDDYYVYTWLDPVKKKLGGDENEFNDNIAYPVTFLQKGKKIRSTIAPTVDDKDFYVIIISNSHPEHHHNDSCGCGEEHNHIDIDKDEKFIPKSVDIRIDVDGILDLLITVYDPSKKPLLTKNIIGMKNCQINFQANAPGNYFVAVETNPTSKVWSKEAVYYIQIESVK